VSLISIERRQTPSYTEERVSLFSNRGDRIHLYTKEIVSLFSMEKRQIASLYKRESVSLFYT